MTMLRSSMRMLVPMAFACACIAVEASTNQWTAIGPTGASITAVAFGGPTIYAGTAAIGVLKSTDDGTTWSVANDGLADPGVRALAVDPQTPSTVYAGTASGLFKSVDAGAHWSLAAFHDEAHRRVESLAIDPATPNVVYAATSAGLYRSPDGATTWAPVEFAGMIGRQIVVDPASHTTLYFSGDSPGGAGSGIYKSMDAGTTWTKIRDGDVGYNYGLDDIVVSGHLAIDPHGTGRLYATFPGSYVITSPDGGTTWSTLPLPTAVALDLTAFAVDAHALYVGTSDGAVLRSTDAGQTWTPATRTMAVGSIGLLASANERVYAGATTGLYASSDMGATWSGVDLGVRRVPVSTVLVDRSAPSSLYADADGALVKSVDGGAHWSFAGGTFDAAVGALAQDPGSPSTLYAGAANWTGLASLHKSVDAGAHWSAILADQVQNPVTAIAIAPSTPSTFYAAVDEAGIIKSTDGGASGRFVNGDLGNDAVYLASLAVDPTDANVVYAGAQTFAPAGIVKVFKTTDGGAHWQATAIPAPAGTLISRLAIDPGTPSTIYATLSQTNAATGAVYKSVDAGGTWLPMHSGLPANAWAKALAIDAQDPQRLYVATSAGVYRSMNAGTSWTPLNAGLPSLDVRDVALDAAGSVLRAATASGLFEYRFADVAANVVTVVEYHHAAFDHYFITANADEIANLDNGVVPGWARTGLSFHAFAAPANATQPVCRLFSTAFAPKSSHFYSPFASECSGLRADPRWLLETADAFDIALPSDTGNCASGLIPVYRLYNNSQGGAPNHRYVTDRNVRAQMIAQGWVPEGLGADAVQMCSPP